MFYNLSGEIWDKWARNVCIQTLHSQIFKGLIYIDVTWFSILNYYLASLNNSSTFESSPAKEFALFALNGRTGVNKTHNCIKLVVSS